MAVTIQQSIFNPASVTFGSTTPLEVTATPTLVSGAAFVTTVAGVEDSMVDQSTSASSWNEFALSLALFESPTYEVLNPSVGAMDGNRVIAVGSGGMVNVKVTSRGRSSVVSCNTGSISTTTTRFSTYVAESDSLALADSILSLIGPSSELEFFTDYSNTQTGGQTSFTKNANCWLNGVNMSGCAIDGNIFGVFSSANKGALITPQHFLGADHWQSSFPAPETGPHSGNGLRIGQTFRWRGEDGVVHSRTIVGVGRGYGDCVVATLNSPLPASVTPFQLAGDWQFRNVTVVDSSRKSWWNGGAVFYLDQQYKARFMLGCTKARVTSPSYSQTINGHTYTGLTPLASFKTPTEDPQLTSATLVSGKTAFFREGVVGDSGSGIFYLVGGEAILVGTFYYPYQCHAIGLANGALANDLIALADANAGISTGYTVTVAPDPTL